MLPRDRALLSITAAGFATTLAQVLLLRELLVLFCGNEMSTALALAGWLLWTSLGSGLAARWAGSRPPRDGTLGLLLVLLALSVPTLVLVLRGTRWLLGIPPGELASLGKMVLVCLGAPVVFCPLAGALFALCWAVRHSQGGPRTRPLAIYGGEAVGAALGGGVFYLVFVRFDSALATAVSAALLLLVVAAGVLVPWSGGGRGARLLLASATVLVLALTLRVGAWDDLSRRWQWGEALATVRDTPYHNIALLRQPQQLTIFTNGLWLFTQPDPATAELAVHPALLQHPNPRRLLLLGGGLSGQLAEALKHPSVERIDYVEVDPDLIAFAAESSVQDSLGSPRVRVLEEDAGRFLRWGTERYDVILMSAGDPINAQMNRFYTVQHFGRVAQRLQVGGIFSFSVPGGGDAVGPIHARFLASLRRTLAEVFPQVEVVPGERARFLAAPQRSTLELDPQILADRLRERDLGLVHVREDTLADALSPFRLGHLGAILAQLAEGPVNLEFAPVCYLQGLMLWAAQWHPALPRGLDVAAAVTPGQATVALLSMGVAVTLFFWLGPRRYRTAVATCVGIQGASGMVLQVILILAFQILEGFAYLQLALIIALFMAGLGAGTLAVGVAGRLFKHAPGAIRGFAAAQLGATVLPLLLLAALSPAAEGVREGLSTTAASWAFSAASLLAGILGGVHFSLAALASGAAGAQLRRSGGVLYAVDLIGSAAGALVAGLLVLPLYGVSKTLILLSAASLVGLVAILRNPT